MEGPTDQAPPRSPRRRRAFPSIVLAVWVVVAALLIAVGVRQFLERGNGVAASATVTGCDYDGVTHANRCSGSMVVGGSLLNGGHVELVVIDGAGSGDVGKTIAVRVSDDHVFVPSTATPLVLIGLGVLMGSLPLAPRVLARRRRPRPTT